MQTCHASKMSVRLQKSSRFVSPSANHASSLPTPRSALAPPLRALKEETPEQALARRQRESESYSERVEYVNSIKELDAQLTKAGSKLVVLEVQSEFVCETGLDGDEEKDAKRDQWGRVAQAVSTEQAEKCLQIKHAFQRIARDCGDAAFLEVQVEEEPGAGMVKLLDRLEVSMLPTLQFWKNGVKLYERQGAFQMEGDLAEGVLYWDGTMAAGAKAGDLVPDLKNIKQVKEFIKVRGLVVGLPSSRSTSSSR